MLGNVLVDVRIRELRNVIERTVITSRGTDLAIDLPDEPTKREVEPKPHLAVTHCVLTGAQMRELERKNMQAALHTANGKLFGKEALQSCWA